MVSLSGASSGSSSSAICVFLYTLLACSLWTVGVRAWEHGSVEEMDEAVRGGTVLVAFVSPDEPQSASFENEWLAAVSQNAGKDYRLMSIDCSKAGHACDRDGVGALPFILLFQQGGEKVTRYRGVGRTASLLNFATRLSRPTVSKLTTAAELSAFQMSDETAFVAHVAAADVVSREEFADVAARFREEFSFGMLIVKDGTDGTKDGEGGGEENGGTSKENGVKVPSVVCYKPLDGDVVLFDGFLGGRQEGGSQNEQQEEVKSLGKWVGEVSRGVIDDLTDLNWGRFKERGYPIIYIFSPSEPERQQLRKTLYQFARSYRDSLTTVLVDPFLFPTLMSELGLDPDRFPAGAVHQLPKDRIFHYPRGKPVSPGAIQQWGLDVFQGRVKPWTPPGVTTSYEDLGPKVYRSVGINVPGVTIRVAGHDEL